MSATTPQNILFGLDSFGDLPKDDSGKIMSHAAAIRQVVKEAVLADTLGIDVIALGEHHRSDFSISSPETVLAGIATQTKNIKLASGVTYSVPMIRFEFLKGSLHLMHYLTVALKSFLDEALLRSHSLCLVTIYKTMKPYSKKKLILWQKFSKSSHYLGKVLCVLS